MPDREVHSLIGASSSERWLACPGSVRLYRQLPERHATEYAATGTVAHALCEECLLHDCNPEQFLGEVREQEGFKVEVTEQMVQAVTLYVGHVRDEHMKYGGKLLVEQPFDLSFVHPGMFGRNDACIVPDKALDVLRVYDYKNGRSPVVAENNPQLLFYAAGALGKDNLWSVESVEATIVQPNGIGKSCFDKWEISVSDLYQWVYDVLRPAAIATEAPDAPCVLGPHCKWCEAAAICPAKREAALSLLDAPVEVGQVATLPAVSMLTPEQLGKLSAFFNSEEFQAWVKALAAEEQGMLARGVAIPGRKLIETTTQGNRKWKDDEDVIKEFAEYGEDIFSRKLLTPAQLTTFLTKMGLSKKEAQDRVNALTMRPETIVTKVVNEDDPRPAKGEIINLFD